MDNQEYWKKRTLEIEEHTYKKSTVLLNEIKQDISRLNKDIDHITTSFIAKNATSNDFNKMLTSREYKQLVIDVKNSLDKLNLKEVNKELYEVELARTVNGNKTRLDGLKTNISIVNTEFALNFNNKLYDHQTKMYEYVHSNLLYELSKETGILYDFMGYSKEVLDQLIMYNWSGTDFSDNIWRYNKEILADTVKKTVATSIIQGKNSNKYSSELSNIFNTVVYNAERLIRTETSFIVNKATQESYNDFNVEHYQFLATLDSRTSKICQQLDLKQFKTMDAVVGKNYPPMHPYCRSTTIPVISDYTSEGRIAVINKSTNKTNSTGTVPANMTYSEYYKKYYKLFE